MFGRRSAQEPTPDLTAAEPQDATGAPGRPGGKGRPTPKRRDAQSARRQAAMPPPKTRKEAVRQQREQARARRLEVRQGMARGQEAYMHPRDKGPVRRYVRDFVDSRPSFAQFLLPFAVLSFMANWIGARSALMVTITSLAFYLMMLLIVVDLMILNRRLKRELATHFPGESTKGVTLYAVMRSLQLRFMRFPKPQIKRGAPVVPAKH
ncbi:MAG: DUF3043 domain-containing protein [Sporichthyaceae bacterium]|nr:DUF3043 domain-containing protein [Sporichthyaceae bacterium]